MARFLECDTNKIYLAAESFLNNCLLGNRSLLFDNELLWHLDLLERIQNIFVDSPDTSDRKFIDKLRDQLDGAEADVSRLATELLSVYFLFPSNVGGDRKRQVVNEVLSWGSDLPLGEHHLISEAFASKGIGSGGQGYNTRRYSELVFLIKFVIEWKKMPLTEQKEVAFNPWLFQEKIDQIEDAESRQIRHMLLHLLFPDCFERIASGNHKRRIITAFADLITTESEGEDQIIFNIRKKLEELIPDRELDFYRPPLVEAWYDDSSGAFDGVPLEIIQHKKQIVLYGPPGTGKTFRAKKLADRIIRAAALRQLGPAEYFQSKAIIDSAVKNNVHRLQLHPAYSYEDFIRALHISDKGSTEYRLGYLPKLIEKINKQPQKKRLPHVLILDEMNRTDLSRMLGECFSLLEDRDQSIDLPAQSDDGSTMKLCIPDDLYVIGTMNLIDQSIEQIDFALRRRFLWIPCLFDAEALIKAAKFKWEKLDSELDWKHIAEDFKKLSEAATNLNKQIHSSPLLGSQYEIGHTYFLDVVAFLRDFLGPKPTRKQNYLWNRKGEALDPVVQLWSLSLRPLLEQYLAGLDATAREAELDRLAKILLDGN